MNVAIIGSRELDKNLVDIDQIVKESGFQVTKLISGGAKGVDSLAEKWADRLGIPKEIIRPNYDKFSAKEAPLVRNKEIIDKSEAVIGVWDGKSGGTQNALLYARSKGLPVFQKIIELPYCLSCDNPSYIFVYASNEAGRHGASSAYHAMLKHGAKYGITEFCGRSYGISTKDLNLKVLPLSKIKENVEKFLQFAANNPKMKFFIVKIGTGLAKLKEEDIAPMFANAPQSCLLPVEWRNDGKFELIDTI